MSNRPYRRRPGRLQGKIALITGAGGAQGRAAARRFAAEGARIVGCDIDDVAMSQTTAIVEAEGGVITAMGSVDLGDPTQNRNWVREAAGVYDGIDILYNNAARQHFGPFADLSIDDYEATVRQEIGCVWHACQAAWDCLTNSPTGVILTTGSIAGKVGTRDFRQAPHAIGKGAVIALTRQLAAEGAAVGIRANSISPGVIASGPVLAILESHGDRAPIMSMIRAAATRAPGLAEDVAAAALFLVSDEARYINGHNLMVDGGASVIIG